MTFFSILHFFSFTVYLVLVLYLLIKPPPTMTGKIGTGFITCLCIWNFSNMLMRLPFISRHLAEIFLNIGSPGWIGFGAFFLWFALLFIEKDDITQKIPFYLVLLGLPMVLLHIQWNTGMLWNLSKSGFGWEARWTQTMGTYIFFGYYLSFTLMALGIMLGAMLKKNNPTREKAATIIFFSGLFSLTAGTLTDVVLPLLEITIVPKIGSVFGLVCAVGMFYVLTQLQPQDESYPQRIQPHEPGLNQES